MNQVELNNVIKSVKKGKSVPFNTLRQAVKVAGLTVSSKNPTKKDLLEGVSSLEVHYGRPKADPTNIIGYKVKIGLRYPTDDGTLTFKMKEGKTFKTVEEGQEVVKSLLEEGLVRIWGPEKTVRAKFIPRYGNCQ